MYLLGRILLAKGKLEAARQAIAQEPDEGWRLVGLALVYHPLGRPAESDAAVKALTRGFSADMPFQIAEVRSYRGEMDLTFEWLDRTPARHAAYSLVSIPTSRPTPSESLRMDRTSRWLTVSRSSP